MVLNNITNLTKLDLDTVNFREILEQRIQYSEMKGSGSNFCRNEYLKIWFDKTKDLTGNSYVKLPIRSNASLNIQNNDTKCFIWFILSK